MKQTFEDSKQFEPGPIRHRIEVEPTNGARPVPDASATLAQKRALEAYTSQLGSVPGATSSALVVVPSD